jgi:hypothetical protein
VARRGCAFRPGSIPSHCPPCCARWVAHDRLGGRGAAAILHSLVVTCRINQVNPFAYLEDVLRRIMDHNQQRLDEQLPDRWQAARPASVSNAVA